MISKRKRFAYDKGHKQAMCRRMSRPRGLCGGEERLDAGGAKAVRSEFIGDGIVDERRGEVEERQMERSRRSWGRRS